MVFEGLPNCNDYKQQQTPWLDVAETKPGAPATVLQSLVSRAANFTRFVTAIKHTALYLHTMRAHRVWWCRLPRGSTGYCLLRYGSDPVLLRRPPPVAFWVVHGAVTLRWTAGVARPKSFRDNHIITHDRSYRLCYKNNSRKCSQPKA